MSWVEMVQTERYGLRERCPKRTLESFGIDWISRLKMRSSFITQGTQSGTIPRSSAQTSIRVACVSFGSFFMASVYQNWLLRR
jgi:hypothetical protein